MYFATVVCPTSMPSLSSSPWIRGAPQSGFAMLMSYELANVRRCLWPATARSRFPAPIGSESSAVPADHRLRLENFQGVQYSRSHTIERGKHEAVNVTERQSLRGFAPQHVELMSKDKDLGLQHSPRPEQSDQGAPDQSAKVAHRQRVSADSRSPVSRFDFAVGTGLAGGAFLALTPIPSDYQIGL
jgi:hypothetical protein